MNPTIDSIDTNNLFSSGEISISGDNFLSSKTLLLIGGTNSPIKIITNNTIRAEIPLLDGGIYDIRVMTKILRRSPIFKYSNPVFAEIKRISEFDKMFRNGITIDSNNLSCINM